MAAGSQESRNAKRLRKACRIDKHQQALAIIRNEAALRIRDGVLCAVVHLTGIFVASDTRLDPAPGVTTYDCLCEACLAAQERDDP